jgi:regulatory protein YycH of two-component signal transduction system YycFG
MNRIPTAMRTIKCHSVPFARTKQITNLVTLALISVILVKTIWNNTSATAPKVSPTETTTMAQTMRFKLTIELSEIIPPTEILSDPANPATRRVQDTHDINRLVCETDTLIELKNALADFRNNLRS